MEQKIKLLSKMADDVKDKPGAPVESKDVHVYSSTSKFSRCLNTPTKRNIFAFAAILIAIVVIYLVVYS